MPTNGPNHTVPNHKPRHYWLGFLPLLFLPNLGFTSELSFGTVEISDILLFPYMLLLLVALRRYTGLQISRITPLLLAFSCYALIVSAVIAGRYGYVSLDTTVFSLLKVASLTAYGLAGVMTTHCVADQHARSMYDWSLLMSGYVLGLALFLRGGVREDVRSGHVEGYIGENAISVTLAILLCYLVGRWLQNQNSRRWNTTAKIGFGVMAGGLILSNGRGGWLAAAVGIGYLFWKAGLNRQVATIVIASVTICTILYNVEPAFREEVAKTIFPDRAESPGYVGGTTFANFDDGARLEIWIKESRHFLDSPLIGTGLFHRGGLTNLDPIGSHNYFLQIGLELGAVGLLVLATIIVVAWRQSNHAMAIRQGLNAPFRASFIAALVGGMGGEYFYGGLPLLVLFLVYAPIGSLRFRSERTQSRSTYSPLSLDLYNVGAASQSMVSATRTGPLSHGR